MKRAIDKFGRTIRDGGVGLFYFSGHGMQVDGRNFLIPVDAEVDAEADVGIWSSRSGKSLGKMKTANNGMNLVILDACRNNPFARSFRSASKGLATLNAPSGTLLPMQLHLGVLPPMVQEIMVSIPENYQTYEDSRDLKLKRCLSSKGKCSEEK